MKLLSGIKNKRIILIFVSVFFTITFIYVFKSDTFSVENEKIKIARVNSLAHKDIVIIAIDDDTIREFDNYGIHWPFPGKSYAKFIRFITTGKPSAIFFDIFFESRGEDHKDFADAIEKSGCTFLNCIFLPEETSKYSDLKERLAVLDRVKFPVNSEDSSVDLFNDVLLPDSLLASKSKGIGFTNIIFDDDKIIRKIPLVIRYKGFYYPCIDLMLVMNYFGISQKDVEIKTGHYIRLKNIPLEKMAKPNSGRYIDIPVDGNGFMKINFIGGNGSFPQFSYYWFWRDGSMKGNNLLKGKICLVGFTNSNVDIHRIPEHGDISGAEYHANAINTILTQNFVAIEK